MKEAGIPELDSIEVVIMYGLTLPERCNVVERILRMAVDIPVANVEDPLRFHSNNNQMKAVVILELVLVPCPAQSNNVEELSLQLP